MEEQISQAVAWAVIKLRQDLDRFKPDKPAVIYALVDETHRAILTTWRGHESFPMLAPRLLAGMREETARLMHHFREAANLGLPANGTTFGVAEAALFYETCADVLLEEMRRIDDDLRVFAPA